ncbi:MAG TPA: glycosyltransferase [Bacteroidia bacterium]|jgi:glycosyltransferase involved in cell wall biosynthesis|nr:glycosyltransferase [Bacteroidia bacterium]
MNGKKLDVLYVSSWYPNKVKPLLGIFFKRHAAALAEVCNMATLYVYADENESIEESDEDGVYTVRVGYKRISSSVPVISNLLKLRRYKSSWKKAIAIYEQKKGRPDIVNLNAIMPAYMAALYLKRKWKIPYVITEQWTGYFPSDGRYKRLFIKSATQRAVKNASAVITVSHDLKTQMLKMGLENRYYVISNIVDTEVFNIPKLKAKTDKISFIHVSVLDDTQKNISGIIKVFQKLHTAFPGTEFTIVGNGVDRASLEDLSKSLGLTDSVHFVGQKEQYDLAGLLQKADAFVLFSNYETQAIVLLEALCCGIPVIATRAGGISEYVTDKNGILIDAKSDEQLYDAMVSIVQNRDRFGNASDLRASVLNKVNAKTIANQFLEVYNKVLNRS